MKTVAPAGRLSNVTGTPRAFVRIVQVAPEFFGVTGPAEAAAKPPGGATGRLDGQGDFLPFLTWQLPGRLEDAVLVGGFNFQGHGWFSAARDQGIVPC